MGFHQAAHSTHGDLHPIQIERAQRRGTQRHRIPSGQPVAETGERELAQHADPSRNAHGSLRRWRGARRFDGERPATGERGPGLVHVDAREPLARRPVPLRGVDAGGRGNTERREGRAHAHAVSAQRDPARGHARADVDLDEAIDDDVRRSSQCLRVGRRHVAGAQPAQPNAQVTCVATARHDAERDGPVRDVQGDDVAALQHRAVDPEDLDM